MKNLILKQFGAPPKMFVSGPVFHTGRATCPGNLFWAEPGVPAISMMVPFQITCATRKVMMGFMKSLRTGLS